MGLRDVFRKHPDGEQDPAPAAPEAVSSPLDEQGQGPVTLEDRTASGGQGSPDTNQGKTEPMPASARHPAPEAPALEDMNVGAADPQSPSHQAARARDIPAVTGHPASVNPGVPPAQERPAIDPDSTTKLPEGPEPPAQASRGTGQRQPGSLGVSPEEQETDLDSGAAHMQPGGRSPDDEPGDAQGVSVPHELPADGTSEQQGIVQGARTAVPPEQ